VARQIHRPVAGPPRVLLLVDALAKNGATVITLTLARRWACDGARLAVLQRLPDLAAMTPSPEVAVDNLTARPTRLRYSLPLAVPRLIAAVRRAEVVVNCSEIGIALPLGFLAARATRKPFVVAVHLDLDDALNEWTPRRLHRLFRWIHRRVDGAICVAPALVAPLVRNGLAPDRITVVTNGIDVDETRRAGQGAGSLIVDDGVPAVVATGRLAAAKGTELLIEAHARVVRELPHRLLLLNDGTERERLRELTAQLGVESSVQFAGAVRNPLPTVASAFVFCLPSRSEGLPLALLEAMALGVPSIASDCAEGVRAALDDGRVGALVPVNDIDALAQALARHLRDPRPLRLLAERGPTHARTFDIDIMARGWASALRDVVDGRRRS
jgi:glycosyltransferase involved in cell wall biosynthesis